MSDQLSGAVHIPSPIQQNAFKACQQQGIIGLSAVTRACNGMLESRSIHATATAFDNAAMKSFFATRSLRQHRKFERGEGLYPLLHLRFFHCGTD
ncbi:hypothetical protein IVB16_41335 (plasmid) [Bradyrhizobium sp. 183]|uniref:hypothetical protein n=1 Tax=unclassified Bradyrhizobium TaxID=2631580 RepID=UPI002000449F|nr:MULTISPECIES: hypothetical protein [unclassified Bradyrhizobium]UPJ84973.1 hypothetical protein IVB17_41375 [Bradyrhizobium sp. 184]UPJ92766.1 hypothetical protein IVB16_41335 [Bradyrhizobium sp. 183]